RTPFISKESDIGLAIAAKLITASTYKKGKIEEGSAIVGVCYGSVKNISRILEKSEPFQRSFPAAEKKSCNARHNTPRMTTPSQTSPAASTRWGAAPK